MVRKYTVHRLRDDILDDKKWNLEKLRKFPILGTVIGEGEGDIRDKVIAKSFESRGPGYETQSIRSTKNSAFIGASSLNKTDHLEFLTLENGVMTSFQNHTSVHDKSFSEKLIQFVKNDTSLVTVPDNNVHWTFEDATGDHMAYMTILQSGTRYTPFLIKNRANVTIDTTTSKTTNRDKITKYTVDKGAPHEGREFFISVPPNANEETPLIFLFHGGGEVPYTEKNEDGILNYTELYNYNAVIVGFMGQDSNNGHSWISSFPWITKTPLDDVDFVDYIHEKMKVSPSVKKICNVNNLHLTGKSDGAGFCFHLLFNSKLPIKRIAVCSGAHFNLGSVDNNKTFTQIVNGKSQYGGIPNIAIGIPFLLIHGTADTVMPIKGQHYRNPTAVEKAAYWKTVDSTLENTYTWDIMKLFKAMGGDTSNPTLYASIFDSKNNKTYSSHLYGKGKLARYITVGGQNHDWSGHTNSGPGSNDTSNKQFDASDTVCEFFGVTK